VVPKNFHIVHLVFDGVGLLLGLLDRLGVSKLLGIEAKVFHLVLIDLNFIENAVEHRERRLASAVVLEEFTFLHFLLEVLKFSVELLDFGLVGSGSRLDGQSDLLLGLLGDLLEVGPLIEQLVALLLVVFLHQVRRDEYAKTFLNLIEFQCDFIRARSSCDFAVRDGEQHLHI